MEERKLNFIRNEDPTIVSFDETKDAEVKKKFNDVKFVLFELFERYTKKELDEGFKETLLSLSESHMTDLLNCFGYEGVLARQKEERHSEIRSLNNENRELRKQLGGKVTNEDAREKLKLMNDIVRKWWNINGFGHLSDESFTGYGTYQAKLSGMITDAYYDKSEGGSRKEKAEQLEEMGFEISREDREQIVDTEKNRGLLKKLLQEKFPSCEIIEYRSWSGRKERSQLRDIHINIFNLDEIV